MNHNNRRKLKPALKARENGFGFAMSLVKKKRVPEGIVTERVQLNVLFNQPRNKT